MRRSRCAIFGDNLSKRVVFANRRLRCYWFGKKTAAIWEVYLRFRFLPRCMECRRGLALRFLSVRPSVSLSVCLSVCLSNACIVTKRNKNLKVSLCENCQRLSCRAFIGLTIHAKFFGGERPLLPEILGQCDRVGAKSPIFDLFSLVASPQP